MSTKPDTNRLITDGRRIEAGNTSIDREAWKSQVRDAIGHDDVHATVRNVLRQLLERIEMLDSARSSETQPAA